LEGEQDQGLIKAAIEDGEKELIPAEVVRVFRILTISIC
jgi:hypothetical protein